MLFLNLTFKKRFNLQWGNFEEDKSVCIDCSNPGNLEYNI